MLTADLVSARRRGEELRLASLDAEGRANAVELAGRLLAAVQGSVGDTEEALTAAIAAVDVAPRDYRLKDALTKLLEDRCDLGPPTDADPEEVRRDVFTLAASRRAALEPGEKLDASALVAEEAARRGVTPAAVNEALFADLRSAQRVLRVEPIDAEGLVRAYERGQAQAVLLRAVSITIDVEGVAPAATRALFRRLKFLRLLHVATRTDDGYRVVVDGPLNMFESGTKYGLQLAQVLPALDGCKAWKLAAEVRWGKERRPLVFRLEGGAEGKRVKEAPLPDEVAALVKGVNALAAGWRVSDRTTILELPGVGLVVPDLVFERDDDGAKKTKIYLEVLGYWSRAAVWKRVELVQAGLGGSVLFAVSSRLRVSEEVLPDDLPSALYVYKGAMSARVVVERLEQLRARARGAALG